MKKAKTKSISDVWKDVKRTPKTKSGDEYPTKNWMDKEKKNLYKVSKKTK
jgi:hypothetical protein